jgi:hypothetical protein
MPQPIMNPNYYNPQYRTPMYGQFMPQQEQFQPQQFMQQTQQNAVQMYGRIVPAQECIAPNEVPMDGNTAFFPKQDMSEIYAKYWGADGKIYTRLYKPVLDADPNNSPQTAEKTKFDLSDEATEVFMNRFDELEQKIEQLKTSQSQRKTQQSQRKDDAE